MKKSALCTFLFLILVIFDIASASDRDAKLEELKALQSALNKAQQGQDLTEANKIAQQIHQVIAELNDMKREDSSESASASTNPATATVTHPVPQEPTKPAPIVKRPDSYEDEILRLAEKRDAEIAKELDPIEKRYDFASQQLLRKTMQNGNLETANRLKGMLENSEKTADQYAQTANSPQERDIVRLMEQREKQIAQATAPIQRRFELATQQLLRKALQTGDLAAANKVKTMIDQAGGAAGENTLRVDKNMVLVNGGTLPQGSELQGQVVSDFEIGKYEVTWGEWQKVRDWAVNNGYDLQNVGKGLSENHPVTDVSWYAVVKWCNAKSEMEIGFEPVYQVNGQVYKIGDFGPAGSDVVKIKNGANGYRLPSEKEWEWAARGGKNSKGYTYAGSNDLNAVGWTKENSKGKTHEVEGKLANELEIYDMCGNVLEWCFDLDGTSIRRLRGGSWNFSKSGAAVASRVSYNSPDYRSYYIGFRLGRSLGN
jgi:formylglycine-generating enzyme required for sulfatase activity